MSVRPLLISLGLVLAYASPATADSWSAPDAVGDVQQFATSERPPPCGSVMTGPVPTDTLSDIVALTVEHTSSDVIVTIALREVRRRNDFYAQINIRTPGPDFELTLTRSKGQEEPQPFAFLAREPRPPRPSQVSECGMFGIAQTEWSCEGLVASADPRADVLTATLPRRCIKSPRWVRVGASVQATEEPYLRDEWGTKKDAPRNNFLVNPLGPRVHAAAP